jgi:hypothetical protein
MRRARTILLLTATLLGGCSAMDTPPSTYAVRDSAGIEIVENRAPAWGNDRVWTVDTIPDFDISGQEDESLSRLGGAHMLGDGRLMLFNGGECQILFYSLAGERLGSVGRCGEGPEDFEPFVKLWPWQGDSTLAVDQLTRVTVLSSHGVFGRIGALRSSVDIPIPLVIGVLEAGGAVVAGLRNPAGRASPGMEIGEFTLGLIHDLDEVPRTLGTYPGPVFEYTDMGGGRVGRGSLAFSSSTQFAAGGDRVFVGYPDRYEIQVYSSDGFLKQTLRRATTPVQVEQRDIDWLMNRRLAEVEGADAKRLVRQAYRDLRHADVMPAFGPPAWPGGAESGPALLPDLEGNLWVFEHYRPGEYRNEWAVFAPDGVWQGTVALPNHLVPSEIGADYVLGSWTDETGFVHIRRHQLNKH